MVRPLSNAHAKELEDGTVTVEQLMNDNSPEAIAIAEELLKKMKPNIAGWEADFGKEMMTKMAKPGSILPGAAMRSGRWTKRRLSGWN